MTVLDVVRGTQGRLVSGQPDTIVTGVSIDSRACAPGQVFFAIRGHRLDGHAFVADAAAQGAAAVVVAHAPEALGATPDLAVVLVEETTDALKRLAAFHRGRHTPRVIAVTGSLGKTTTKELSALVLGRRFRVLKAAGSLNNQWGLPLTLLRIEPTHEVAVLELGMNALGEIATLAALARPDVGVVTTIAPAHLEFLGSIEGIQAAKGELVQAIPPDGVVVLNADDPLVLALARKARGRVVTYGEAERADVRVSAIAATDSAVGFRVAAGGERAQVELPMAGRHNVWNAAAAVAVGQVLGVPLAEAAGALREAAPIKGRLLWREAGGVRILDDTYNANPKSLRAALETFAAAGDADAAGPTNAGARAWVILGDMLELGPLTESAHVDAGHWVAAFPAAGFAAVGGAARAAAAAARAAGCPDVASFETPGEAATHVAARVRPGDRILVKGSRGMQMERAVVVLLERLVGAGRPC